MSRVRRGSYYPELVCDSHSERYSERGNFAFSSLSSGSWSATDLVRLCSGYYPPHFWRFSRFWPAISRDRASYRMLARVVFGDQVSQA